MCLRGTVSHAKFSKILDALSDERGNRVNIDFTDIALPWKAMSSCSSAEGFQAWMLAFKTAVSNKSDRRMVILLNQAEYSGLSIYTFVRDAMLEVTDFPWTKAAQLIMGDFRAYRCAHALLKNSPYYGYDSSFAAVDASKYRSLGWLSWEILQKSGHHTLDKYSGFRNASISHEQQLRALINAWDAARRREDIVPSDDTKREVAEILQAVRPGDNQNQNVGPDPVPNVPVRPPMIRVVRTPVHAPHHNVRPVIEGPLNPPAMPHSHAASNPSAENRDDAEVSSATPSVNEEDEEVYASGQDQYDNEEDEDQERDEGDD